MSWQETNGSAVAQLLGSKLVGPEITVNRPASFGHHADGSISFLARLPEKPLNAFPACLIIAPSGLTRSLREAGYSVVEHQEPKFAFCKAVSKLMAPSRNPSVHESAVIGPDVRIGANVSIGPYCVLDGEIELCEGVTLEPHVQLSNKVTIGRNSIVRGGTRIGYDPFSFGASDSGEAFLFPSTGGVEIGTDVDIFHNCSIARGTAGNTVIEDNVRICNQAHIGNTVEIGKGTTICAATDISARVKIGPRCWIAQSAAIRQGLCVGADSTVGMGAVVVKDVPSNATVMGVPARLSSADEVSN